MLSSNAIPFKNLVIICETDHFVATTRGMKPVLSGFWLGRTSALCGNLSEACEFAHR